jgi:hypothetical protein
MLLLILGFSGVAHMQSGPTGSLSGVVRDQNEAPISRAKITVVHVETGLTRDTAADGEGQWILSVLPTGDYKVTVEAPNFKKAVARASVLPAARRIERE